MAAKAVMLPPDDRCDAGYELLSLMDSVGFDVVGGGWGYADETELWRFYLFTEMLDEKGPLWIWERLLKVFRKLNLPAGMTPLDIVIASPHEWLYRSCPVKQDDRNDVSGILKVAVTADLASTGYGIDRMWLLRARPERGLIQKKERRSTASLPSARVFDLKVRQLMAA